MRRYSEAVKADVRRRMSPPPRAFARLSNSPIRTPSPGCAGSWASARSGYNAWWLRLEAPDQLLNHLGGECVSIDYRDLQSTHEIVCSLSTSVLLGQGGGGKLFSSL
jgi:hypothetical protein